MRRPQDVSAGDARLELDAQQKGARELPMQRVGLCRRRREAVLHEGAAVLTDLGRERRVPEVVRVVAEEGLPHDQRGVHVRGVHLGVLVPREEPQGARHLQHGRAVLVRRRPHQALGHMQ